MIDLIKHLNNKILINDLIVKKMKYEVNMLFFHYPSKERAKLLANRINAQLDTALIGLNEEDKECIRRKLIENSFLVLPHPVSEEIHYGHIFTTLTNYDASIEATGKRLTHWLDLNTEITYDEKVIHAYIHKFKIDKISAPVKSAAIEYIPPQSEPEKKYRYKATPRMLWIPVAIVAVVFLSIMLDNKKIKKPPIDIPELYEHALSPELSAFIDGYYHTLDQLDINPYGYQAINISSVYTYLNKRDSMLTSSDYLTFIDNSAAASDLNPLLLLAIIGQEQSFVPKDHPDADLIINNPYNVFGSWIDYNTNFEDATSICIKTIRTAMDTQPEDTDLIEWLNQTYAEDKNWSVGVKAIFTKLQSLD